MMLMDCVLQYGLSAECYHPNELSYKALRDIFDAHEKVSIREQAHFEIILTDAVITLMNHLHYGRLNPEFPAAKIDSGIKNGFNAGETLSAAMLQKKGYDFFIAIENVQPQSKAYRDMQYHLMLLTGLYTGDSYEFAKSDIRIMSINLERLRWANMEGNSYIQINIPSYTLSFHEPDTTYQFKAAVGKPGNPTPAFNSGISYFTTAPDVRMTQEVFRNNILPHALNDQTYLVNNHLAIYDRQGKYMTTDKATLTMIARNPDNYYARHTAGCDKSLGKLVFHLPNRFGVDLYDIAKQSIFDSNERALTNGCIWVEHADRLAALLLTREGKQKDIKGMHKAVNNYKRNIFILNKPLPVNVTYLTCEVKEGELITYKDIYNLDKSLEIVLYQENQNLALR